ncbi:MAG: thioredoxin family protein [Prevotella sp.]|nr:thioredoxin family protein [Prevotella sp.]
MRRISLGCVLLFLATIQTIAQIVEPVHFSSSIKELSDNEAEIVFSATIDPGWHVYSTDIGDDGPVRATFNAVKMDGVKTVGALHARTKPVEKYDEMFGMNLRFFEGRVVFVQKVKFTKPKYNIDCYLEYGACNASNCLPPTQVAFQKSGDVKVATESQQTEKETVEEAQLAETSEELVATEAQQTMKSVDTSTWSPVISELKAFEEPRDESSMLSVFLWSLLGGLIAVVTPCVWPVIPMTVSFFLKRNKSRGKAIREALTYGASIIVIYVAVGLLVTLISGPSALNALSTNAWFNVFLALLLVVFAASFFGAFELALPSSWSNKMDRKSDATTGILSIFFMAFTLVLVSFSCTGPIIGFLLVALSTQESIIAPTIGMLGFAIGLAVPFALFALFPSLLKSAPKSGGWMNQVKVVLGFVELAFALKFFSVADLAYGWHLLDREVFVSLWIVIFGLLGAYLLGWLKFPHDDDDRRTSVPRFALALASLAFAVYMIPGLWGAPLKAISAFAPPMYTQDFNLYGGSVEAKFRDYDEGMAFARQQGKPVMVDFTGFGCVNCRKMEAAVWTDPQVQDFLNKDYVLISLYVDDKTPLAEPITVTENGQQRILRTIGDKWSYLQRTKVGANTQPCYVLLTPDGKPLEGLRSYDEDIEAYVKFLKNGLKNFGR